MNIKELKKQLKREKENYYDKDKLKISTFLKKTIDKAIW